MNKIATKLTSKTIKRKSKRRDEAKINQKSTKRKSSKEKTPDKKKQIKKGGGLKSTFKRKLGIVPGKGEILAFDEKGKLRYYTPETFNTKLKFIK